MAQFTYSVIRDCGYGRVWSRLATDRADALSKVDAWRREGRKDGLSNGGEYYIRPVTERPNDIGGFFYDDAGPNEDVTIV